MASFSKRGKSWLVRVRKGGVERTATFHTKADATDWALKTEAEILAGHKGEIPKKTFGDLLRRFMEEVLPGHDGERQERFRLEHLFGNPLASPPVKPDPIVLVPLAAFDTPHVVAWRDRRLKYVKPSSVNREWNTLSKACSVAKKEWRWLRTNPFTEVSRPVDLPPRDRRPSQEEIERLILCGGYSPEVTLEGVSTRVVAAFLFAIETALRLGEMCALKWSDVDFEHHVVKVAAVEPGARKGGVKASRKVPLSHQAVHILNQLKGIDDEQVFKLNPKSVDILFRRMRSRMAIEDLHFHDSRREALTRLAPKVDPMTLAKISGHRDLATLLNTYYAPDMSKVAALLN